MLGSSTNVGADFLSQSNSSLDPGDQSTAALIPSNPFWNPLDSTLSRHSSYYPTSLNANTFSETQVAPTSIFTSGWFTVGGTGQVGIDYLYDGGSYQGDVGIFSLEGLDEFVPGSTEFIQTVVQRVLSNSTLGHLIISDKSEGARFESYFNAGDYIGVKTFGMNAGDRFGMVLVPNGTFYELAQDPTLNGSQRPLFSLSTANPIEGLQFGQIADVTGNGSTFVFEDLRLDGTSDRDYEDIVLQVRGAIGFAAELDEVINPGNEWRNSTMGQAILNYIAPYDNPMGFQVGNYQSPKSNQPLIGIIDTGFAANNPDIDYNRIILGRDYVDGDNNPLLAPGEGNEHGTHILGIIGATRNNGIGIDGMNDQAPLWLGRAISSGKWAESLVEFVNQALETNQPNAVVNLSLDLTQRNSDGTITTRYEFTPKERAALEYARQSGVLIVAAAGNDGGVMSALGQASQEFDNIITVGAADGQNRTDYSSYGYGLDILALGGTTENGILSTVADGVGTLAGTSVATAHVTGAISQVWAANPNLNYRQVLEILKLMATDVGEPNWDTETGVGLMNVAAAVELAKVTQPQEHDAPSSLVPETWTGEGQVMPVERAVGPFNYPINNESFSGTVGPNIGVNLRYSPWFGDRGSRNEPKGKRLQFDAWTYGERGTDLWLGTPDDLWYRVAGTNLWVPSAYIAGYPGSRPPVLAPGLHNNSSNHNSNSNSNSSTLISSIQIGGYTIGGNFYQVFDRYRATLGNPRSNSILYSPEVSYQLFERGSIVRSKHGTFPLYGGIRQTFLNTGGLNGWLGAPKSAEVSQGNGVVIQYFENGYIIWNGRRATAYQYGNGNGGTSGNNSNKPVLIRTGGGGIGSSLRFLEQEVSNLRSTIGSLESQIRSIEAIRKENTDILIPGIQQRERRISEIRSNPLWFLWPPNHQAISTLGSEISTFRSQKDINDRSLESLRDIPQRLESAQSQLNNRETELQNFKQANAHYIRLEPWKNDESWWENEINDWSDAVEINQDRDPNSLGKLYRDLSSDLFGRFIELSAAYISDDYKRATQGGYGYHGGIDIGATRGTLVKAVVSGIVVQVANSWGAVTIKDAQGINHIYGHMAGIKVKQGDSVTKGQVIGSVSDVGTPGSVHLHYEVAESQFPGGSLAQTPAAQWRNLTKDHFRNATRNPLKYYWEMQWNG